LSHSVAEAWARFEHALPKLRLPDVALAPGAPEAAIGAFETATGVALPDAVRAFFRTHDGQTSSKAGLASGFYFVSLTEAEKLLAGWAATRAKLGDGIKELDRSCSSDPRRAIQRKYSLPGWVPLLRDDEGNAVGVDLEPGALGASGQIINFGRDEEEKHVLFPNVAEMLDWLATELESDRIRYDATERVVRHTNGRLVAAILEG
jgi:cell wall assembly regulator SMI1